MMKGIFLIVLFCSLFCFPGPAFNENIKEGLTKRCVTQEEFLDLSLKISGLGFFITDEQGDREYFFEKKKKILVEAGYPAFSQAKKEYPLCCGFFARGIYQLITPPEEREVLSDEDLYALLKGKGYDIFNYCANCGREDAQLEEKAILTLFRKPELLNEILHAMNPMEFSPYSTPLSEEYSTPASPVR